MTDQIIQALLFFIPVTQVTYDTRVIVCVDGHNLGFVHSAILCVHSLAEIPNSPAIRLQQTQGEFFVCGQFWVQPPILTMLFLLNADSSKYYLKISLISHTKLYISTHLN